VKRAQVARLRDMLREIDLIADMIEGIDPSAYSRDKKLRRAVERCVEIVSEASRRLPAGLKEAHPDQPWPEIAAIGNLLRHEYQRVDDLIMWKIASQSLPALRPVIADMLKRAEE
jgi:uncharacterized protein with HEPN domain